MFAPSDLRTRSPLILIRLPLVLAAALLILCATTSANGVPTAERLFITNPDRPGGRVEYFVQKPGGHGPWPTIVFLHGFRNSPSNGGEVFVEWGLLRKYASRGYLSVAISEPGFGASTGPADFCGPVTVDSVIAVIAALQNEQLASRDRIVVEGISRGALVAGMAGARDPSISGLVLISGEYDLRQFVTNARSPNAKAIVKSIQEEAGMSAKALRERSVLDYASDIRANTLILNGAKDDRTDPSQARQLARVIKAHGAKAQVVIYPEFGHNIPVAIRNKIVDRFIASILGPPSATTKR